MYDDLRAALHTAAQYSFTCVRAFLSQVRVRLICQVRLTRHGLPHKLCVELPSRVQRTERFQKRLDAGTGMLEPKRRHSTVQILDIVSL